MIDYSKCSEDPIDVEDIPEQEDSWRKEITAMTVQLQDKRKSLQHGEVLRGVHPKSHGCLDAFFVVKRDLHPDLRVGLFADAGRLFKAKIRFSNADVLKRADLEEGTDSAGNRAMMHGSRGMAIKVLDVDSPVLVEDMGAQNQDFLMVNTPEFAFRNVRDYRRLTQALVASENGADPDLFFLPGELLKHGVMDMTGTILPPTASETPKAAILRKIYLSHQDMFEDFTAEDIQGVLSAFAVVSKIRASPVRNPLEAQYFSAAPFRYGPDRVMRFSVASAGVANPASDFDENELSSIGDDYLTEALSSSIAKDDAIELSFRIQIATASDLEGKTGDMIENASLAWDENKFPFVEVAKLAIHPKKQEKQLVDACKPLLFSPWHALADHEPLGGINRLRKPVYSTSATFRRSVQFS